MNEKVVHSVRTRIEDQFWHSEILLENAVAHVLVVIAATKQPEAAWLGSFIRSLESCDHLCLLRLPEVLLVL